MCAAWSVLGFVRTPARAIILCETAGQSLWDCGWLVTVCASLCRSLCEWEPLLLSGCYSFQWRSKSLSVDQPANQAWIKQSKEILALHKWTRMLKEKEAALDHIQENLLRKLSDLLSRRGWSVGVLVIWCNAGPFLSHPCYIVRPVRSWRLCWRHCLIKVALASQPSEACLALKVLDIQHCRSPVARDI